MWMKNRCFRFGLFWSIVFWVSLPNFLFSQAPKLIYQPELVIGHIVPNFQDYPPSGLLHGIGLSICTADTEQKIWQKNFPNAKTGIYLGVWNMGNDSIFGRETTIYPFVQFPLGKHRKSPLYMRVGLGAAHFSKHFTVDENVHNIAVGSGFTWAFEGSLYWKRSLTKKMDLSLSGKFLHGSNGHTQLPNFGINSGALGLGIQYHPSGKPGARIIPPLVRDKVRYLQIKPGIGLHELGGTRGPVNGPKYGIASLAGYYNIQFNHRNRLKLGLIFRQYNSYASYIQNHSLDRRITPYSFSFALGHEFLMGRVGIDVDGLLHLYKPFYRIYFDEFGPDSQILFLLHRWLGARIGFNAYLLPPSQNPPTNIFFGVHLNTNNGEADYSSITLGIEHQLR